MSHRENLYNGFVTCSQRYSAYLKEPTSFVAPDEYLEIQYSKIREISIESEKVFLHIQGPSGSGRKKFAQSIFQAFFEQKGFCFHLQDEFQEPKIQLESKKFFLVSETSKISKKILENSNLRILVLLSDEKFSVEILKEKFRYILLPLPFSQNEKGNSYFLLSYFLSKLSPTVSLSQSAFLYYVKQNPCKNFFELKFMLLWAHFVCVEKKTYAIREPCLKEALNFVRLKRDEFLFMEQLELCTFSKLIKSIGYKKCFSLLEDLLIEKIYQDSQSSYTHCSRMTKLPITTFRSKRLKYLGK